MMARLPGVETFIFVIMGSPFSEVIGCTRADSKVVLMAVNLIIEGSHEVVDLRDAECDSAAYVELDASAQG